MKRSTMIAIAVVAVVVLLIVGWVIFSGGGKTPPPASTSQIGATPGLVVATQSLHGLYGITSLPGSKYMSGQYILEAEGACDRDFGLLACTSGHMKDEILHFVQNDTVWAGYLQVDEVLF